MNTSIKTEISSGIGMFFAIWTVTFLYSRLMEPIGFSSHYWFTVTAFFVASGCIISALMIKKPYIVAPGLGVGWFAASQILPQSHLLNFYLCIFMSGFVFMAISHFRAIQKAGPLLPNYLQATMSIGIGGLFMRLAVEHEFVHSENVSSLFLFFFTVLSLLFFKQKQNRWGALITVAIINVLGFLLHQTHWQGSFAAPVHPKNLLQLTDLSVDWPILFRQILEMSLFSFFDIATGILCLHQIQIALGIPSSENKLPQAYLAAGLNNLLSGFFLCGPNTLYIESALGMELGGRKTTSLWITAACFLMFVFCFPIGQMIPKELFEGIFFFIGLSLLAPIYQFKKQRSSENMLSILLIALIILSKSILNGLLVGLILHYCLSLIKRQSLNSMNHFLSLLALSTLAMNFMT